MYEYSRQRRRRGQSYKVGYAGPQKIARRNYLWYSGLPSFDPSNPDSGLFIEEWPDDPTFTGLGGPGGVTNGDYATRRVLVYTVQYDPFTNDPTGLVLNATCGWDSVDNRWEGDDTVDPSVKHFVHVPVKCPPPQNPVDRVAGTEPFSDFINNIDDFSEANGRQASFYSLTSSMTDFYVHPGPVGIVSGTSCGVLSLSLPNKILVWG